MVKRLVFISFSRTRASSVRMAPRTIETIHQCPRIGVCYGGRDVSKVPGCCTVVPSCAQAAGDTNQGASRRRQGGVYRNYVCVSRGLLVCSGKLMDLLNWTDLPTGFTLPSIRDCNP